MAFEGRTTYVYEDGDIADAGLGSWFSKLVHTIAKKPFKGIAQIALVPFTAGASLHPQFFKKPLVGLKTTLPIAAAVVAAPFVLPAVGAGTALTVAKTGLELAQQQAAKKKAEQQAQQVQEQVAQAQQVQDIQQAVQQAVDTGQPITQDLVNRAAAIGIKISPIPTEGKVTTAGMIPSGKLPYVIGAGIFLTSMYFLFADRRRRH